MDSTGSDAGRFLHERLWNELNIDEFGLKCRIAQIDEHTKRKLALDLLPRNVSGELYEVAKKSIPWNSSKFSNAAIMHLTCSPMDMDARRIAITHTSMSLGGNTVPQKKVLDTIARTDILNIAFEIARSDFLANNLATVFSVSLYDVDLIHNPSSTTAPRANTFSHNLTMTLSQCGTHIYQGYGPIGYTLKQYLESHQSPLDEEQLSEFLADMKQFLTLSVQDKGNWTLESNNLYKKLFGIDLVASGAMRVGSQFHPFLHVQFHSFTTNAVQANFDLLPRLTYPSLPCQDSDIASGIIPCSYVNVDGGIPRRSTPHFVDLLSPISIPHCNYCGFYDSNGLLKCSRCVSVSYCCKEHQKADWKKHKQNCQPK
jgi:hypothetical protein